jgi:UDP-N-acetylmuramate dehydrogenase
MRLASLRAALGNNAIAGELMSRHTTFGIGGPADLFVLARTQSELCTAVQLACEHNVPYFILGGGANLLVADKGIRGLVIQNQCTAIAITPDVAGEAGSAEAWQFSPESTWLVHAQSGALLKAVARQTVARDLAGLEWAVDVPGTVGGAVVGNAGAFGGYVSDNLCRALVLTVPESKPAQDISPGHKTTGVRWAGRWWSKDALQLGYRTSILKENRKLTPFPPVILEVEFALHKGDAVVLKERVEQYTRRRLETQPAGPSAGSVFKRTAQYPAGFLIENAGLKDTRIGGAVISPQHANFIVNVGGATAQDVRALIELVREKVYAQFKIMLELEVELVGDW